MGHRVPVEGILVEFDQLNGVVGPTHDTVGG